MIFRFILIFIMSAKFAIAQEKSLSPTVINNASVFPLVLESDFLQDQTRNGHPLPTIFSSLFNYWYECQKANVPPILLKHPNILQFLNKKNKLIDLYKSYALNPLQVSSGVGSIEFNGNKLKINQYKKLSNRFYKILYNDREIAKAKNTEWLQLELQHSMLGKKTQANLMIESIAALTVVYRHQKITSLKEAGLAREKVRIMIRDWFSYWHDVTIDDHMRSEKYENAIKIILDLSKSDHPWLYKLFLEELKHPLNAGHGEIYTKITWEINDDNIYTKYSNDFLNFVKQK